MKLMFVPLQIVRWSSRGQVIILRNVLLVTSGKYDTSLGLAAGQQKTPRSTFPRQQSPAASISINKLMLEKVPSEGS